MPRCQKRHLLLFLLVTAIILFRSLSSNKKDKEVVYEERPWYLEQNGSLWSKTDIEEDKIAQQLMLLPPKEKGGRNIKRILLWNRANEWTETRAGDLAFRSCPVSECTIVSAGRPSSSDLVVFKGKFGNPGYTRPNGQLWMWYSLESPPNTPKLTRKMSVGAFNWTATYRSDSTVAAPYAWWVSYGNNNNNNNNHVNYAENKTKLAAWFVSNCEEDKNGRMAYLAELKKHMEVDVFGRCGDLECPRGDHEEDCFKMLRDNYKFYLAFENSNCREYITEKFFLNALKHDVVPVAMGAPREDYDRVAPFGSFVHVDDFADAAALAQHLKTVDADDRLYNEYFRWKGSGEFADTRFFCRLCALLHHSSSSKQESSIYTDLDLWWRKESCISSGSSWRDRDKYMG